jgi:hypothetical protein
VFNVVSLRAPRAGMALSLYGKEINGFLQARKCIFISRFCAWLVTRRIFERMHVPAAVIINAEYPFAVVNEREVFSSSREIAVDVNEEGSGQMNPNPAVVDVVHLHFHDRVRPDTAGDSCAACDIFLRSHTERGYAAAAACRRTS